MRRNDQFSTIYGPWALIAGASAGLGAAYADRLAERGLNLVLIARREKELSILAESLTQKYAVSVRMLPLDLGLPDFLSELAQKTCDLNIGLVVYNATFPAIGEFLSQPLENHMRLIDINCRAPVRIIHHFGGIMKKRNHSGIILMSSLSAFQGTPYLSHYGASKAYTLILGEGLARELKSNGIDLLVCCAGATRTENYLASLPKDRKVSGIPVMEPRDVAEEALEALGRCNVFVPGILNKFASFFMSKVISRKAAVSIMQANAKKLYGKMG
jgi:Short-chain dehydrogenases of various substrate specificities